MPGLAAFAQRDDDRPGLAVNVRRPHCGKLAIAASRQQSCRNEFPERGGAGVHQPDLLGIGQILNLCGVRPAVSLHRPPSVIRATDLALRPGMVQRSLENRQDAVCRRLPATLGLRVGCGITVLHWLPCLRSQPWRLRSQCAVPRLDLVSRKPCHGHAAQCWNDVCVDCKPCAGDGFAAACFVISEIARHHLSDCRRRDALCLLLSFFPSGDPISPGNPLPRLGFGLMIAQHFHAICFEGVIRLSQSALPISSTCDGIGYSRLPSAAPLALTITERSAGSYSAPINLIAGCKPVSRCTGGNWGVVDGARQKAAPNLPSWLPSMRCRPPLFKHIQFRRILFDFNVLSSPPRFAKVRLSASFKAVTRVRIPYGAPISTLG